MVAERCGQKTVHGSMYKDMCLEQITDVRCTARPCAACPGPKSQMGGMATWSKVQSGAWHEAKAHAITV